MEDWIEEQNLQLESEKFKAKTEKLEIESTYLLLKIKELEKKLIEN